ncbi:hypothetical protein ZIOFF_075211 [Zingiber officinale]|uniref:Ethanolaminephosphotransferase n=1 Tax=Zingiber officinale TaxID=94328 RepID=A0A8J5EMZ0_ZINOF|nr:hypothetical protein ZIOFF_075211 [Zingiber officinale]
MGYIGQHGVATLHKYKYSGVDHSLVAKYILQPFWTRCVTFFPLWMPPNMITLTGFLFLMLSALLGYIYSPRLDTAPPRWVHLAHGLLLFLYQIKARILSGISWTVLPLLLFLLSTNFTCQNIFRFQTFDAVDGKQARRTNSSSPLGELFDHGCDALACAKILVFCLFLSSFVSHFFCVGLIIFFQNAAVFVFLCVQELSGGHRISESQFLFLVGCHFFLGLKIPVYVIVLVLMIAFAVVPTLSSNISNVQKVVQAKKGSMILALAMLFPFGVLMAGVLIWSYLSPSDIMRNYPHLLVTGTGFAFGFLVVSILTIYRLLNVLCVTVCMQLLFPRRMILAHLCDEPKGLKTGMCMSLLFLPLAIANALTAKLNDGAPLVDEQVVLVFYCLFTVSLYLHFATSVIHEITSALGIYCFRITRKEA